MSDAFVNNNLSQTFNNNNSTTIYGVSNYSAFIAGSDQENNPTGGPVPTEYSINAARFNDAINNVYGGSDVYNSDNPALDVGFRQPYVYTKLTDSDLIKYIKKYDTRAFPIGSTVQDTERIGKLMISGKGILFNATQFFLQGYNAFNETSLYNPLMPITAVASYVGMGLVPRPRRFINISNFSIGSLFGFGNLNSPPPTGTLVSAVSKNNITVNAPEASYGNGTTYAGLQRARTASAAYKTFSNIWGTQTSDTPSFLATLASTFLPSNLAPMPTQNGIYKIGDTTTYDIMTVDKIGRFTSGKYVRNGSIATYSPNSVIVAEVMPNTPDNVYDVSDSNDLDVPIDNSTSNLVSLISSLTNTNTRFGKINSSLTSKQQYQNLPNPTAPANIQSGNNYESQISIASGSYITKYGFSTLGINGQGDQINESFTVTSNSDIKDLAKFYFYDVYNKKYLPFRNTITDLNFSTNAEWEEYSYIGRADNLYTYKGFSRTLSFSFIVYANRLDELGPSWARANYLASLLEPIDYVQEFIVPPFVKVTIGNLFVDQPCILDSFQISIVNEQTWDIDNGLPQSFSCAVDLKVLQKDVPNIANLKFAETKIVTDVYQLTGAQ